MDRKPGFEDVGGFPESVYPGGTTRQRGSR